MHHDVQSFIPIWKKNLTRFLALRPLDRGPCIAQFRAAEPAVAIGIERQEPICPRLQNRQSDGRFDQPNLQVDQRGVFLFGQFSVVVEVPDLHGAANRRPLPLFEIIGVDVSFPPGDLAKVIEELFARRSL